MANEIPSKRGTPVVFADATDFTVTTHGFARTAQIDLTSLANGAARQSDKVDFGALVGQRYKVIAALEFAAAPTAGNEVRIGFSGSASGTAATGNCGGASGSDGAYKGSEEAEWFRQLIDVGPLIVTNDIQPVVQIQCISSCFILPERYGQVIVYNTSGQALDSDATNMMVAFVPWSPEVQ